MNVGFRNTSDLNLTYLLPFGFEKLTLNVKTKILISTIQFYNILAVLMSP